MMTFTLILRILQLAASIAVLVLSILAIKWQWVRKTPPPTAYATFAGTWGCLFGLIGLLSMKSGLLTGIFTTIFDASVSIFFLIGGIICAVALKGINCSRPDAVDTWGNKLISGGCVWNYYGDQRYACGYDNWAFEAQATRRCRQMEGLAACLFIGFVVSLILTIVSRHGKAARAAASA